MSLQVTRIRENFLIGDALYCLWLLYELVHKFSCHLYKIISSYRWCIYSLWLHYKLIMILQVISQRQCLLTGDVFIVFNSCMNLFISLYVNSLREYFLKYNAFTVLNCFITYFMSLQVINPSEYLLTGNTFEWSMSNRDKWAEGLLKSPPQEGGGGYLVH